MPKKLSLTILGVKNRFTLLIVLKEFVYMLRLKAHHKKYIQYYKVIFFIKEVNLWIIWIFDFVIGIKMFNGKQEHSDPILEKLIIASVILQGNFFFHWRSHPLNELKIGFRNRYKIV